MDEKLEEADSSIPSFRLHRVEFTLALAVRSEVLRDSK